MYTLCQWHNFNAQCIRNMWLCGYAQGTWIRMQGSVVWYLDIMLFRMFVGLCQYRRRKNHSLFSFLTLWGWWRMLTHTYPCKHPRKTWERLKWPSAVTRLTSHFICGLIWWFVSWKKMIIYDSECPDWDLASLSNAELKFIVIIKSVWKK